MSAPDNATPAAPRLMANSAIAWGLPYHQKPHAENEHCADLKCDLATEPVTPPNSTIAGSETSDGNLR